jgi:hypothetical protein
MGGLRIAAGLVTILVITGVVVIALAYWQFTRAIAVDLVRLSSDARSAGALITDAMLAPLPPAAQRYFRYAGVVERPVPRLVRLTQKGRIRNSETASWMDFEADETYSTSPPAFIWRAWLPARVMPVALGRDEYLEGKGSILIKLLSLVPVADEHGEQLAAAGLMRYLNESMWFPSALLGPNAAISPVDDSTFRVTLTDRGMTAEALFVVDGEGRLVTFRAQRFNTASNSVESWETPVAGYRSMNGLNLPTTGSAVWKRPAGDLTYIELEVTSLSYEQGVPRDPIKVAASDILQ